MENVLMDEDEAQACINVVKGRNSRTVTKWSQQFEFDPKFVVISIIYKIKHI